MNALRRKTIDEKSNAQAADNSGATAYRERERSTLRRDPVFGKDRGQVRSAKPIRAERRQHDDAGQNPERPTTEGGSDCHTGGSYVVFMHEKGIGGYAPVAQSEGKPSRAMPPSSK